MDKAPAVHVLHPRQLQHSVPLGSVSVLCPVCEPQLKSSTFSRCSKVLGSGVGYLSLPVA